MTARFGQFAGRGSKRNTQMAVKVTYLSSHHLRVRGRERPYDINLRTDFVIMIRLTLMGMAMKRGLDDFVVIMWFGVMNMLMESDHKDRQATHRPQNRACNDDSDETLSH
ncbi:MAG: hypothetical protein GY906_05020 [bacterium]|nr:hypothetical protein [bacterium]